MQRMQKRSDHYFPPDLLNSQLDTLEEPDYAFTVSVDTSPEAIVQKIVHHLASSGKL
jgi:gluconate kinase